jgi:hypothetical protein
VIFIALFLIIAVPFGLFMAISQRRVIWAAIADSPVRATVALFLSVSAFSCLLSAFWLWEWQDWYPSPVALLGTGIYLSVVAFLFWFVNRDGRAAPGCLLWLALVLLAPSAWIAYELHRVAPILVSFGFTTWSRQCSPAREQNGPVYIKGKIVTVDADSGRLSPLMFSLPVDLMARRPPDVGTIVTVGSGAITVGRYTDGTQASTPYVKIRVIDAGISVLLAERLFLGGVPDAVIGLTEAGRARGSVPYQSEVVGYLVGLPRSR